MPEKPVARDEFESLYARHSREVWALAYARWMDADSALDIMQEVFLRLWKHLESGGSDDLQNPRAWLLRVARNLAEDYAKSSFRKHGTSAPEMMGGLPGGGDQPLEQLEREEAFARIRGVLEEMAAPDREVLTLRYALDYDAPLIAEMLGVAITTIHMRLSRARNRLAEKLTEIGVTKIP